MDHDVVVKRAEFNEKSVEVRTMLNWAALARSEIWVERRPLMCILLWEEL